MDPVVCRRGGTLMLLLLIIQIAFFFSQIEADVVTLTSDTFTDKVKELDTVWFVQFCVPWCKHCKNLGTLWEDLGKAVEGEDEIEIGQVGCSVDKPICSKADIHSYPTFKVFYDGEEIAKYKGPRTVESLKSFVLEEAKKAARKKMEGDSEAL